MVADLLGHHPRNTTSTAYALLNRDSSQSTGKLRTLTLDADAGSAVIAATHQQARRVRVQSKVCDRSP